MAFQLFVSFQVLVPQKNLNLVAMLVLASFVKVFSLLKLVSAIFYQIIIFSRNGSTLKTMKNVFYFT